MSPALRKLREQFSRTNETITRYLETVTFGEGNASLADDCFDALKRLFERYRTQKSSGPVMFSNCELNILKPTFEGMDLLVGLGELRDALHHNEADFVRFARAQGEFVIWESTSAHGISSGSDLLRGDIQRDDDEGTEVNDLRLSDMFKKAINLYDEAITRAETTCN